MTRRRWGGWLRFAPVELVLGLRGVAGAGFVLRRGGRACRLEQVGTHWNRLTRGGTTGMPTLAANAGEQIGSGGGEGRHGTRGAGGGRVGCTVLHNCAQSGGRIGSAHGGSLLL